MAVFKFGNYDGKKNYYFTTNNVDSVADDSRFEDYLGKVNRAKFDKKKFDMGEAYFNIGGQLEDAPEELRNDQNFVNGYNRGKRLALIKDINGGKHR